MTRDFGVFNAREAGTFQGSQEQEQTVRKLARRAAIPASTVGWNWRLRTDRPLRWTEKQPLIAEAASRWAGPTGEGR